MTSHKVRKDMKLECTRCGTVRDEPFCFKCSPHLWVPEHEMRLRFAGIEGFERYDMEER